MAQFITLKDTARELRVYGARTVVALIVTTIALILVFGRYFSLQVTDFEAYRTQSERNRVQLQALPPKRGLIYDRNGTLLADNRPSHTLSVIPERVGDIDATLQRLGGLIDLSADDVTEFRRKLERRRPYDAIPLRFQLSEEEQARVAVNRHGLPGVVVEAQLLRHYPYGEMLAHVLGYVGRINENELETLDSTDYRGTFHIGKVGVEHYYEDRLHGEVGYQNVETNAHGRVLRVLDRFAPEPGDNIFLYLDLDLQRIAVQALGDQRGAIVAIDPATGGVLAMASTPAYDGNLFVNGISSRAYAALRDSPDVPLFNRAVQGQYPPGSTVKPLMALAGLQAELITPETTVPDPGWYRLPGSSRRYRDWTLSIRGTGHAPEVDLNMAIAESCDVYFYDLARRLGIDPMHDYLAPFGLGSRTGVDTTGERGGVLPSSRWKRQALNQVWYPGETLSAGIGQGYMLATPLQLAVATATVANRGQFHTPRLARRIAADEPETPVPHYIDAAPEHWESIFRGMRDVVHGARGTARSIGRGLTYDMAGKTGTSQVIGIAQDAVYDEDAVAERHRHHGLFIAFAPVEAPEIAVAVIVENGGGSSAAYPLARSVIDAWLTREGA